MKIAYLAPFEERVPPVKYGGTELMVYNIVEGMVRKGHDVTLLASGDSKTSAKLIHVFERHLRSYPCFDNEEYFNALKLIGIGRIMSFLTDNKFDIIHNHFGWRLLPFLEFLKDPCVTTLHSPLDDSYKLEVYKRYLDHKYISISKNQQKPLPEMNIIANVYNGIDLSKYEYSDKPKNYYAFLGRISHDKGPEKAVRIAKKAGVKLLIGAKKCPENEFFKREVKPYIDGKNIKLLGEVGHKEKIKLLKNAKALLFPIQWEEPFGLVMIEAMACGTPVIAFRRGSVPEIVKDGKTGFIVNNVGEAVNALKKIDIIDRKECRKHVERNFSEEKMVNDYEKVYKKVLKKKK
jgi:glycosyltransferase involved in cell wall biosynthesis